MANATDHAYTRLPHELARRPDLVEQLLVDHPVDRTDCPGCCMPGGRSVVAAPCSIRTLALLADSYARGVR